MPPEPLSDAGRAAVPKLRAVPPESRSKLEHLRMAVHLDLDFRPTWVEVSLAVGNTNPDAKRAHIRGMAALLPPTEPRARLHRKALGSLTRNSQSLAGRGVGLFQLQRHAEVHPQP